MVVDEIDVVEVICEEMHVMVDFLCVGFSQVAFNYAHMMF